MIGEKYSVKDGALSELLSFLKRENYYFITPTPATHQRVNQRVGNERSQTLMDVFGWNRSFEQALLPIATFKILAEGNIISETPNGWKSAVRVSTLGDEILLHSSFPTVSADAVFFGPDTYRFVREIRTHLANNRRPVERSLDIGCGTGAGGVVIARSQSTRSEVIMSDINEAALQLTRINSHFAGLENTLVRKSNLFQRIDGKFDLIVSNPPYLNDPLGRSYRHGGGPLGNELSVKIAEASVSRLNPLGTLLLYTGSPIVNGRDVFFQIIAEMLAESGLDWSYEEVDPDVFGEELDSDTYAHADRIAAVVLIVRNTGS